VNLTANTVNKHFRLGLKVDFVEHGIFPVDIKHVAVVEIGVRYASGGSRVADNYVRLDKIGVTGVRFRR
jgi:hypothetical protein